MGKKITIYDLAEKLNVSPATISRALNDHPSISAKTKEKVISAAKKSGYKVNKFAANLSNQKSNTIGVIVPKLNSYFLSTVLAGMEQVANEAGYNLIITQSLESMKKEQMNAQTLYNSGVDALIISLAYDTTNYDHLTVYTKAKIPLVLVDRVHNINNCSTLVIDNRLAGFDATEHLIEQGCKNILHITGNLNRNVYSERFSGYKSALEKHGLSFKSTNLLECDLDPKQTHSIVQYIKNMDLPIDGISVSNDGFAACCIRALKAENYRIPEDIKIIGFNNDPICELITPTLSTIDYPGYKMGVLAAQSIINHLNGNINLLSASTISLRHKLVVRQSTQ